METLIARPAGHLEYASASSRVEEHALSKTRLSAFFNPRTVAVIGATEKPASVGRSVLRNLLDQPFGATIFPVNPTRSNVLGIRCYKSISAIGYMRYFHPVKLDMRVSHQRLITKCFIDYDHELALVAEYTAEDGTRQIAGIARLVRGRSRDNAEVAFVVVDKFQNRGLGSRLLERMIAVARIEGIKKLEGEVLSDNYSMRDMFTRQGFHFEDPDSGTVGAWLELLERP
jgi:GNAT superfamily N-acetyltransferase